MMGENSNHIDAANQQNPPNLKEANIPYIDHLTNINPFAPSEPEPLNFVSKILKFVNFSMFFCSLPPQDLWTNLSSNTTPNRRIHSLIIGALPPLLEEFRKI